MQPDVYDEDCCCSRRWECGSPNFPIGKQICPIAIVFARYTIIFPFILHTQLRLLFPFGIRAAAGTEPPEQPLTTGHPGETPQPHPIPSYRVLSLVFIQCARLIPYWGATHNNANLLQAPRLLFASMWFVVGAI